MFVNYCYIKSAFKEYTDIFSVIELTELFFYNMMEKKPIQKH